MNNYVVLDGKRYRTPWKTWTPIRTKPGTVRVTLLGQADVTFGGGAIIEWQGDIEAPVAATAPWGTISDLRTTLDKTAAVTYTDHEGNNYEVACFGPFKETSFTPKWDDPSNHFTVNVRIIITRRL